MKFSESLKHQRVCPLLYVEAFFLLYRDCKNEWALGKNECLSRAKRCQQFEYGKVVIANVLDAKSVVESCVGAGARNCNIQPVNPLQQQFPVLEHL